MARSSRQWAAELYGPGYHRRQAFKAMVGPLTKMHMARAADETCAYCRERGTLFAGPDGKPWHFDHVVPLSRGGALGFENVVLACGPCNMAKGTMTLEEWRPTAS